MPFLYAAFAIMAIVFLREYLRKRYNFDMDNVDISNLKNKLKPVNKDSVIRRTSGSKRLILLDAGDNKATVMATLRQITGIDYNTAKQIVNAAPSEILADTSEKEASLTKQALEFVGAKVEIK
ncbi:MAG: ribosomal protein L7/L12 [Muribaculaceae bacterium]|nr:ribosomal protein L7/L12 [Muribaculaceae bacterium]